MIIIHMTYMDVADNNPVADKNFQPNLLSRQQNAPIQSKFPFPASPLTIYTPQPKPYLPQITPNFPSPPHRSLRRHRLLLLAPSGAASSTPTSPGRRLPQACAPGLGAPTGSARCGSRRCRRASGSAPSRPRRW